MNIKLKLNEQVSSFFKPQNKRFSLKQISDIINEQILLYESAAYDIVAGEQIRKGRMPVNMGNTSEGIFAIGLITAMQYGTPITKNDIITTTKNLYPLYMINLGSEQHVIESIIDDVSDFSSNFPNGMGVKLKIALNAADMVTLFMPLGTLPDSPENITAEQQEILQHILYLRSGNTDSWALLAKILLTPDIDPVEKEKALLLLKGKYEPVANEYYKIANGVASFWNQKGGGKRGYEDIVADTLKQVNPDNLAQKNKTSKVPNVISVVADGISANLATTADAYVTIGDDKSGTVLFSYSLKKGSDQIFQTGAPGSGRQFNRADAVGGGIEYMFLKFGLPPNSMPQEAIKFYACRDNAYSKPETIPGDECGATPSKEKGLDKDAIQTHVNVWNDTSVAFANAMQQKLKDEIYKTQLLGSLAIMITKTKEELDMEYVNLGTSAKTTVRAFPGLISKYSRHFEFGSSKIGTGNILEEYGSFQANQPSVYTEVSNPIKRDNLCLISSEGIPCADDKFEVRVSEIKKLLSRGGTYIADFFDPKSANKIFDINPAMKAEFVQIVQNKLKKTKTKSPDAIREYEYQAFKQVVNKHISPDAAKVLLETHLSEDDILDMVVNKLNSMLPKPGHKVFTIRIKARISSKSKRHDWRTILEKGHGMKDIMDFVKYAKYLKYEAGESVLQEVEDILDASLRVLEQEEERLKLRSI